mmetsp:Transcript_17226/g.49956  ORF Transcript_17226/g.49956 Transcript_17226/m.49956 type:complete len:206 (-) Transcript_17226:2598-3215(-)
MEMCFHTSYYAHLVRGAIILRNRDTCSTTSPRAPSIRPERRPKISWKMPDSPTHPTLPHSPPTHEAGRRSSRDIEVATALLFASLEDDALRDSVVETPRLRRGGPTRCSRPISGAYFIGKNHPVEEYRDVLGVPIIHALVQSVLRHDVSQNLVARDATENEPHVARRRILPFVMEVTRNAQRKGGFADGPQQFAERRHSLKAFQV